MKKILFVKLNRYCERILGFFKDVAKNSVSYALKILFRIIQKQHTLARELE